MPLRNGRGWNRFDPLAYDGGVRGLVLAVLVAACAKEAAPPEAAPVVRFRLGFWAETGETRVVIGDRTPLPSGTPLYFVLDGEATVYVVYRDSADGVAVCHAGPVSERPAVLNGHRLDDTTGLETFYVVASDGPHAALETAVGKVRAAPADAEAGRALLAEIQELRKRHERLATEAARPAPIGGQVRGEDEGAPGVEYDVEGIRCLTFTIDHRA